jgi:5-formyltetrahydrofolate cyclo-ligase
VHVRLERKALNAGGWSHLVALVESNGSHRHCGWRFSLLLVTNKSEIRSSLLAARRAVAPAARARAALAVARHISLTRWLAPGKRIGIYASMPQELGTAPLIALALERRCEIFLPRITSMRARRMQFVPFGAQGRFHSFGMHEPSGTDFIPARFLDTIFVAGVAFDRTGGRLGHGAGFYDRALAFRHVRRHWRGPRLVGVAYAFQVVPRIPVTANDVGMDFIVTDRGIDESLADENGPGLRDR